MMPERVEIEEWKHEELADAERYDQMAKEYPEYAEVFHFLAKDERSHAQMMEFLLHRHE